MVPSDRWETFGKFLPRRTDENSHTHWVLNTQLMDEEAEKATRFVLRSNWISDSFEALEIYRNRNVVEQDFRQLKSWIGGNRLRVDATNVTGQIFVQTLVTTHQIDDALYGQTEGGRQSNLADPPRFDRVSTGKDRLRESN